MLRVLGEYGGLRVISETFLLGLNTDVAAHVMFWLVPRLGNQPLLIMSRAP